jgi:hypothetical protein
MREFVKSTSAKSSSTSSPNLSLVDPSKPTTWYIQSNHPDDFGDVDVKIPSVIAELTYNFKQYAVERSQASKDYVRIGSYPLIVSTIVDTIRHQTESGKPIGEHPSLCCFISLGIPQIQSRDVVKKLGELSMSIKRRQKKGNDLELYIQNFLKSPVDCPVEKARNIIITVTPEVNDVLSQLSFDTGLTKSSAAMLATYATLIQQIETPPNYKQIYQDRFDTTIKMLECKLDAVKAMINRLNQQDEREQQ